MQPKATTPATGTQQRRPRAVMLVANSVTGDSRVQKVATSMASAGWEVYLLGRSRSGRQETSRLGAATVIRIPVDTRIAEARRDHTRLGLRGRIGFRSAEAEAADRLETRFRREDAAAEQRLTAAELAGRPPWNKQTRASGTRALALRLRGLWLRLDVLAHRTVHAVRRKARHSRLRSLDSPSRLATAVRTAGYQLCWRAGGWRRSRPQLIDFDLAFGPVIDSLEPDLLHAHDISTLGTAVRAATRAQRATGRPCRVVYDSHEFTAGIDAYNPVQRAAYLGLEREYIHRADAVVTVSQVLAGMLRARYRLAKAPTVVANCPERAALAAGGAPELRAAIGLPAETPLLVYSGWLAAERGVETVVRALPALAGVHLALVSGEGNRHLPVLVELAERLGVADRVHVQPYVRPDQVTSYLASATVGVIPLLHRPNHEVALITKYYEYLHAGLPIVVSDVRAMADHTRGLGNGEVFTAGRTDSFVAAVQAVLADPDRYTAAYQRPGLLEEYSWEVQAQLLDQLYRQVTGLAPEPLPVAEPSGGGESVVRSDLVSHPSLAIGPSNMAGQAWAWAKAVEERWPAVRSEVFTLERSGPIRFPADRTLSQQERLDLRAQDGLRAHVLERHTHVLLEGGMALTGSSGGGLFPADAKAFTEAGLRVGLVFHGSDIRDPRRHRELYPDSPFADPSAELTVATQRRYDRLAAALAGYDGVELERFVSTPDLMDFVDGARWLPVTVDTRLWRPRGGLRAGRRPVVLHAPSRAAIKGSAAADAVAQRLHEEGLIEYRRLEGVEPEEMPAAVAAADIVLDQFAVGSYGVLAAQAMAVGRVVVGHVADHVRARLLHQLPVVEARQSQLGEVLEKLVGDADECRRLGELGPEFVRRYHDGTHAAGTLAEFLVRAGRRPDQEVA